MKEKYMKEALIEAKKAYLDDEVPIGAIIVYKDQIIARAHNTKEKENNPLCHAEIIAIDQACKQLGDWRLSECDLYVTVEPCLMCCGAILHSRIRKVIYGTANSKPCSDSSATPSFPSQPEGKIGLPRANPRGRLRFPVVTRECRRNSRKTTWFPPLGKMRPLPATASQGKSPVPP